MMFVNNVLRVKLFLRTHQAEEYCIVSGFVISRVHRVLARWRKPGGWVGYYVSARFSSERMERTVVLRGKVICVCMPHMSLGRTMSTPVENNHLVAEIIFPGSRVTNSELTRYTSSLYCVETPSASFLHFYFLSFLLFVSFRHIPS
jgi:hypothetical protein